MLLKPTYFYEFKISYPINTNMPVIITPILIKTIYPSLSCSSTAEITPPTTKPVKTIFAKS